ncbi:MAG TPA: hypothetical protein V6C72_13110, partial [Chroococcales cyanobacterium]
EKGDKANKKTPTEADIKACLTRADKAPQKKDPVLVDGKDYTRQASTNSVAVYTGSQTVQGATNGTIGPDATYVTGVNTAGTVHVNEPGWFFFKTKDSNNGQFVHQNFIQK